jgi:hypothetical protein
VPEVVGEIHHGHSTATELALDAVMDGERGLKAAQSIGQAGSDKRGRQIVAVRR